MGWKKDELISQSSHQTIILDRTYPRLTKLFGNQISAAFALMSLLNSEKPDYLICYGYTLKPQMLLICWAILTATQFALIGDANYFIDRPGKVKAIAKSFWLRWIVIKASALIAIGTASTLFWQKYGATPSKIFRSVLAVDNQFFIAVAEKHAAESQRLRSRLGFGHRIVFLFVGRLVKRKNVDLIIRAARHLDSEKYGIVIAGEGEDGARLKHLAVNQPNIVFAGNITPAELPVFYKMADVLLLPADQEPWGLVINEAMACGLAIIAYRHCGAAVDLVDASNGVKLCSFSVEELVEAMKRLAHDESALRDMQAYSRLKIQDWSIEKAAEGIVTAVGSTYRNT